MMVGDSCAARKGYGSFPGCSDIGGTLSDDTFSLASDDYTISTIVAVDVAGDGRELSLAFGVGEAISTLMADSLALQLNSREFVFNPASFNADSNSYTWTDIGLSWSGDQMVSVKLCVK